MLVDRTVSLDFTTKTVCGQVNSLSPFVLARPIEPQLTKRQTLDDLIALRAAPNLSKLDTVKLDDAIKQLSATLDHSLWIDGFHLQPKNGDKDFDEEKQAVNKLRELLHDEEGLIARTTPQQLIEAITGADKVLALTTTINDAIAANGNQIGIANAKASS